jgi:hypothetical protein
MGTIRLIVGARHGLVSAALFDGHTDFLGSLWRD